MTPVPFDQLSADVRRRALEQAGEPATPTRARRTAAAPQVCVCRAEGCGVVLSGETAAAKHTAETGHARQEWAPE